MIYMFLANGFEEIEALATLDILRRAEIEVQTVSLDGSVVTGTHGIKVYADIPLCEVNKDILSGVILPGGMPGTTNLLNCDKVLDLVRFSYDSGFVTAAICAAPMIFGEMGLLQGEMATCYPGFEKHLKGAKLTDEYAVVSGNIITGKGAGAAFEFAFKIVEKIKGKDVVNLLKGSMQCIE